MIDIAPDVMLIALELLELSAHHKQALLRVKRSSIGRLQISSGNRIDTSLHLPQSTGSLGVALSQTIDFRAGLLQQQIDLFELLLSLLQLGARFFIHLRGRRRSSRSEGNLFLWAGQGSTPSWKIYHRREMKMVECP